MKRMFLGMLATETNTFSPVPTGPNVWKDTLLVRRSDPRDQDPPAVRGARALLGKSASERGWEVVEGCDDCEGDILTRVRGQGYSPSLFSGVGIDPERKHILVVKSTQHFHAGFAPFSKQVLYAGDLGALPGDMTAIPLRRADTRRLWPLVADPFNGS